MVVVDIAAERFEELGALECIATSDCGGKSHLIAFADEIERPTFAL
jgi:hypothetical protein